MFKIFPEILAMLEFNSTAEGLHFFVYNQCMREGGRSVSCVTTWSHGWPLDQAAGWGDNQLLPKVWIFLMCRLGRH